MQWVQSGRLSTCWNLPTIMVFNTLKFKYSVYIPLRMQQNTPFYMENLIFFSGKEQGSAKQLFPQTPSGDDLPTPYSPPSIRIRLPVVYPRRHPLIIAIVDTRWSTHLADSVHADVTGHGVARCPVRDARSAAVQLLSFYTAVQLAHISALYNTVRVRPLLLDLSLTSGDNDRYTFMQICQ